MKNKTSEKPSHTLIARGSAKPLKHGPMAAPPSSAKSWTRKLLPVHAEQPVMYNLKIIHVVKSHVSLLAYYFLLIFGIAMSCCAQTSLNVTSFGARGDAVELSVNTVSNST